MEIMKSHFYLKTSTLWIYILLDPMCLWSDPVCGPDPKTEKLPQKSIFFEFNLLIQWSSVAIGLWCSKWYWITWSSCYKMCYPPLIMQQLWHCNICYPLWWRHMDTTHERQIQPSKVFDNSNTPLHVAHRLLQAASLSESGASHNIPHSHHITTVCDVRQDSRNLGKFMMQMTFIFIFKKSK